MSLYDKRDGHYDEKGYWVRDKICFMDCGDKCTCKPPKGLFIEPNSEARENIDTIIKGKSK